MTTHCRCHIARRRVKLDLVQVNKVHRCLAKHLGNLLAIDYAHSRRACRSVHVYWKQCIFLFFYLQRKATCGNCGALLPKRRCIATRNRCRCSDSIRFYASPVKLQLSIKMCQELRPQPQSVPKCCSRPSQIGAPHPVIGSHPSAATKPLSQPHEVLPTTTSLKASPG